MIRRFLHLGSQFVEGIRAAAAWAAFVGVELPRFWNELPTAAPPRRSSPPWDEIIRRSAARGRQVGIAYRVESLIAGETEWVAATKPLNTYGEAEDVVLVLERNREPGDQIAYRVVPVVDRSALS